MKGKYSWKFQSTIQEILTEQDKCIVCGGKKNLSVHHIVHTDSNEEKYADKDNIVLLCRDCHIHYHKEYPNDCNLLTFIEFVKNNERRKVMELEKQIQELNIERNSYLDLINYITQIQ